MIHENNKYKVILIDEAYLESYGLEELSEPNDNYAVINKEHNVVEATTKNLPQALTFCDQFDAIIESKLHKVWADQSVAQEVFLSQPLDMSDESTH